jgi:hypothetical protein
MRVRTVFVIAALVCGSFVVGAEAEEKPVAPPKPAATKEARPPGGGTYCCSSECCDLHAACEKNPANCTGWNVCHQANNNCSCTGKCKYPPNVVKQAIEASTDPVVKAAGTFNDCQWQCLTILRGCLQQCTAKGKPKCQTCTETYASCERGCGSPAAKATGK